MLFAAAASLYANQPGGFTSLVTTSVTSGTLTYRNQTCRYLDNGIIRAVFSPVGNIQSIRYLKPGLSGTPAANGVEMISQSASSSDGGFGNHTEIYYYWYPDGTAGTAYHATTGTTNRLELVYKRPYTPAIHQLPMNVELHYALGRGETMLYVYAALDHPAAYPQADLQFIQMIWPIAHNTTDFLCENLYIDDDVKLGLSLNGNQLRRNSLEPTYGDIKKAVLVPGLPGEINQLTSGPFSGQLTGKYSYNIPHNTYKAWGRASDINDVGEWVVAGSQEYGNNGPTRREYVHGWGLMYHMPISNHYSNGTVSIPAALPWTKIIGPWGLYFNGLPTGAEAWTDAKAQGDAEKAAWPYAWVTHPAYQPQAQRATLTGKLVLTDALRPAVSAAGAWVGLAAPDSGENSADNWQFQADRHQYWVRADAEGNFTIPDIQTTSTYGGSENYQLYVYSAGETPGTGAVGEFRPGQYTFTPGESRNLGTLPLTVSHPGGSLVWEIGIPDRSAAEFRHGDEYAKPALWLQYGGEYSNPHNYDVAAGNWATNFNFSHTCDYVGATPWKWNLNFNLAEVIPGTYWLTIAYASADSIQILRVNDNTTFAAFTPPNARPGASSFLRQAVQTKYTFVRVPIPAGRLRTGANTISLDHEVHTNHATSGFMYDYISLEAPTPPVLPPGRDLSWKGGVSSNAWNTTAANWLVKGTTTPNVTFVDGDRPEFGDSGTYSPAVTTAGILQPGRMTFSNTTAKSVTLGGAGILSGPFELLKTGNGTVTLSPFQQSSSATTVATSTGITLASTTGLTAGLTVTGTGIATGSTIASIDSPTTLTISAPATASGTNNLTFGASHSFYGGSTLSAGTVVFSNSTANTSGLGAGPVTFNGGTLTMWDNQNTFHTAPRNIVVPVGSYGKLNACSRVDLTGSLSGGGTFEFYVPWIRTTAMGNWSGFNGLVNIRTDASGGDWRVANNVGCPQAAVNLGPLVTVYSTLSGNQAIPIGELSGSSTAVLAGAGTAVTRWIVGSRNSEATYSGSITNGTSPAVTEIEKKGDGTWTLAGSCSHTGQTVVSGGTLRITGTSSSSPFTVQPDAALGGTGTITGSVTFQSGGIFETSPTPLAIVGNLTLPAELTIRSAADPGPGTHVIATCSGTITGSPVITLDGPLNPEYSASISISGGQVSLVLIISDADHDLLTDAWELLYYPSYTTAGPLDDTDGDGFNTWVEFQAGTSPVNSAEFPPGATTTVRTSDSGSFDGTLCEVNYSGVYDGGFVTSDTSKRNNVYQNTGLRHFLTVLKFDLSAVAANPVADTLLNLTVNGSTAGARSRTLSLFNGDDSLITTAIGYNAANPFIDEAYVAETNTDTDFALGAVSPLFAFTNSTVAATVEAIGSGNVGFKGAVQSALASDKLLTLVIHGGNVQYLAQGDEDATPANRPALTITTTADPAPDTDSDAMPDAWEAAWFGTLLRDGTGDADRDGTSDLNESRLGLSPKDPAQSYRATVAATTGGRALSWPSLPGLRFEIRRSVDLSAGSWQTIGSLTAAAGTSSSFTDTLPPAGRAFYQIVLLP